MTIIPHRVVGNLNSEPRILTADKEIDGSGLVLQWYGDSNKEGVIVPGDMQFKFPFGFSSVYLGFDDFMKNPELFRVAFVGQVKYWPYQEVVQVLDHLVGDTESWCMLVCSPDFKNWDGSSPWKIMVKLNINLMDPDYGVLTPRRVWIPKIIEDVEIEFNIKNNVKGKTQS